MFQSISWLQYNVDSHQKENLATYRHAIKGQLAVNFELVGRGHPSTRVHQGITELEGGRRQETREKARNKVG